MHVPATLDTQPMRLQSKELKSELGLHTLQRHLLESYRHCKEQSKNNLPTISSLAANAALNSSKSQRYIGNGNGHYNDITTSTLPRTGVVKTNATTSRTRNRYASYAFEMNDETTARPLQSEGSNSVSGGNVTIEIEPDDASLGQGRVVDPDGFGGRGVYNNNSSGTSPIPSRSHYHLSRNEVMKGLANRFVHSTGYIYFYAGMAIASLLTVFLSLLQDCPGTLFYSLELAINALLIAEVGIRGYAFGKQFWKSTYNVVDLCLVLLCAITLTVLFFSHDCSPYRKGEGRPEPGEDLPGNSSPRGGKSEELLDSLLLILRNGAQLFRLLSVVRRSSSNVTTRVPNIDLDDARRYSLDLDLEEEGLAARERMADGGDLGARRERERQKNGTAQPDERRQLFDYEDDDDEL